MRDLRAHTEQSLADLVRELDYKIENLQANLALAVEALEFYAQDRNYSSEGKIEEILQSIELDEGQKAREALAKIK